MSTDQVPREWWLHAVEGRDALAAQLAECNGVMIAGNSAMEQALDRIRELEAALQGIAKLAGLTLLGGDGMESDRAYQHGAHAAFGQAAEMASAALETP